MKLVIIILIVAAAVSFSYPQMESEDSPSAEEEEYHQEQPGIWIVGGSYSESDPDSELLSFAEVFLPGFTCAVGDMPEPRAYSSLCHGLVCGGRNRIDESSRRSCDKFEANGTFSPTAVTLIQERFRHLCWGLPSGEVLLMGGGNSDAATTTERVSPDGSSSSADFTLPYRTRRACGIDLGTSYVVTGGQYSRQRVTQYSLTGEVTELPDLITGRDRHACSQFVNTEGVTTLLVTGGTDADTYYNYLSSTEIFTLDSGDWMAAASLPSPRAWFSGATIGNTVFVFGGRNFNGSSHHTYDDILQYEETTDTWRPSGKMKTPRSYHSVFPVDDVSQLCG